jgi:hypothetical protein
MKRTIPTMRLTGAILASAVLFLTGCVPLQVGGNKHGGKFGKSGCCESCENSKKAPDPAQFSQPSAAKHPIDRKVLPEDINSANYQKMLKTLEDEVSSTGTAP